MQHYNVRHLSDGQTFDRPAVFANPLYKERSWPRHDGSAVEAFHRALPDYNQTQLHELPSVATELGLAFKVLGASWAVHKAICRTLEIEAEDTSVGDLATILRRDSTHDIQLVTCTAGNWGRAVARMAKYLRIPARIYVPGYTSEHTKAMTTQEAAELKVNPGKTYDDALAAAQQDSETSGALLVQDVTWHEYEDIPAWAIEGYGTMLLETDRQVADATGSNGPNLVIAATGGGLWAQAVVAHYKGVDASIKTVTVEPDTATGFKESLHCGENTIVQSGVTIMEGMNSGRTDDIAWPILRDGTDVAVAVTNLESHKSVRYLQDDQDIDAGPCGGATLAALRNLCQTDILQDKAGSIVVLFSTEGNRDYDTPL